MGIGMDGMQLSFDRTSVSQCLVSPTKIQYFIYKKKMQLVPVSVIIS